MTEAACALPRSGAHFFCQRNLRPRRRAGAMRRFMATGAAVARGRTAGQSSLRLERITLQAIFMLAVVAVSPPATHGVEQLAILTQPGPGSAISGLIGYGKRLLGP